VLGNLFIIGNLCTPDDVANLALDWAVTVNDRPELMDGCLWSTARLTGYEITSLHSDVSRSGGLLFTIVSAYASAI
jgi:hypothetical protein